MTMSHAFSSDPFRPLVAPLDGGDWCSSIIHMRHSMKKDTQALRLHVSAVDGRDV